MPMGTGRRKPKEVKKRWAKAKDRQIQWRSSWQDAYRFCLPQRDIVDQPQPGQPKGDLVFDSTGMKSAQKFANRLQALLFPPYQKIVKLEPGPAIPKGQRDQVSRLLEQISDSFHDALHQSNFDTAIGEMLIDYTIGTGSLLIQPGPDHDPLQFDATPIVLSALEPGPRGTIGGIFREHKVEVGLIKSTWTDIETLPGKWEEMLKENSMEEVTVLEYTYFDPGLEIWYYDLFGVESNATEGGDMDTLLEKPRVYDQVGPWVTPRWVKAANEIYGRGPVLFAMPDIKTVNKTMELILKNASMAISGTYTGVDDGVFNPDTAVFAPGVILPVARNDGPFGPTLKAVERAGDFDVAQLVLQELRDSIRQILFDKGLPDEAGPIRSATEIIERLRELQVDIGGAFGRIMKELVVPIVLRCLIILNDKGIINFPVKIDGQNVKIRVVSPLAQQQNFDEVEAVLQWIEISQFFGPEIFAMSVVIEELPAWFGRKLGVPEELIRDNIDKSDLRELIAQFVAGAVQQGLEGQGGEGAEGAAATAPVGSTGGEGEVQVAA